MTGLWQGITNHLVMRELPEARSNKDRGPVPEPQRTGIRDPAPNPQQGAIGAIAKYGEPCDNFGCLNYHGGLDHLCYLNSILPSLIG